MKAQTPRHATGADALMLGLETPTAHYHTMKMGILDMSGEAGGYSFEAACNLLARRLHLLPPFRWKLLPSPLGINHPLIVEDASFELDKHIKCQCIPAPGDLKAMCSVVSELAGEPLDRNRPLWELHILEGLPETDKVGFLLKVHHAIADGTANVMLMKAFCSTEPGAAVKAPSSEYSPLAPPSWLSRLLGDIKEMGAAWRRELPRLVEARRNSKTSGSGKQGADPQVPPATSDAPVAPWNGMLTSRREIACCSMPLADVMIVKSAFGVSVNDVVLAILAGALRRYMFDRNALQDIPLVATMPISIRTEEEMVPWGNRISAIPVSLPTNIADPVERLLAGHKAAQLSKQHYETRKGLDISGVSDLIPDFLGQSLLPKMLRSKAGKGISLLSGNLGISNVPGPSSALYVQNTKVETIFSAGMLHEGAGLGVTVWSYADQFNFSLLACPDLLPDLWQLTGYFDVELKQLLERAKLQAA